MHFDMRSTSIRIYFISLLPPSSINKIITIIFFLFILQIRCDNTIEYLFYIEITQINKLGAD